MKHLLNFLVLISIIFVSACAGHDPNPVMVSQYGDDRKSCNALELEMSNAQGEMQRLIGQTNKTGQNVVLGITGWFLIVPWFFMDFKNGEKVEYDAWRQRYMHLVVIAEDKHCSVKAAHIPTSDELIQASKEARKKAEEKQSGNNKSLNN